MTTNTISEETTDEQIKAMYTRTIPLSKNIAENSTWMRRHLVEFAKKIDAVICTAGIEFAQEDDLWNDGGDVGRRRFYRLAAVKIADWHLVIEEDNSYNENTNVGDARLRDGTRYILITDASRHQLEEMIKHLPAFMTAYCDELERQNLHFADLREKADAMLKIVEG